MISNAKDEAHIQGKASSRLLDEGILRRTKFILEPKNSRACVEMRV